MVRVALAPPPPEGGVEARTATVTVRDPGRELAPMIIFLHPRATSARSRRYPLSVLALAAVIEGREEYEIVDGNVDGDPFAALARIQEENPAELLAVSVMPGPQMVA